jgi:hypothetical protein
MQADFEIRKTYIGYMIVKMLEWDKAGGSFPVGALANDAEERCCDHHFCNGSTNE